MVDSRIEFQRRVKAIGNKHSKLGRGMTASLRGDGLIVIKPKGARPYLPARGALLLIVGFLAFKGFMLAALGPTTYDERVAELRAGSAFEQAGAAIMMTDPVSRLVAETLGPVLR